MDYNCKKAVKISGFFVMAWLDKSVAKNSSLHHPNKPLI